MEKLILKLTSASTGVGVEAWAELGKIILFMLVKVTYEIWDLSVHSFMLKKTLMGGWVAGANNKLTPPLKIIGLKTLWVVREVAILIASAQAKMSWGWSLG